MRRSPVFVFLQSKEKEKNIFIDALRFYLGWRRSLTQKFSFGNRTIHRDWINIKPDRFSFIQIHFQETGEKKARSTSAELYQYLSIAKWTLKKKTKKIFQCFSRRVESLRLSRGKKEVFVRKNIAAFWLVQTFSIEKFSFLPSNWTKFDSSLNFVDELLPLTSKF